MAELVDSAQSNPNGALRGLLHKSAIDEPSNPYFLHHSDIPGLMLVSQPLTGDNYTSWSRAMLIALSVKNNIPFIDGSLLRPGGTDSDLLNSWMRNNNIVISWILNSTSKEISASVIYAEFACEIWNDLRDRFQQRNGPRIFQLRRELMNLVQGQDSVSVYFTKLKTIWEELNNYRPVCSCAKCSCGGVKDLSGYYQMEYVMSFLMGLNDSYAQIRGQLLLMDPLPPINKAFSLISQEENQRKIGNSLSFDGLNSSVFVVKKSSGKKPDFTGSSTPISRGNTGYSNNGNKGFKKDRPFCTHCNSLGHTIDRCYKLYGYPPGYKARVKDNAAGNSMNQVLGSAHLVDDTSAETAESHAVGSFFQNLNSDQYHQLMSMLTHHLASFSTGSSSSSASNAVSAGTCFSISLNPIFSSTNYWIVDSGATRHICYKAALFHSLRPISNSTVTLPNQTSISVSYIGNVSLGPNLLLKDVLLVPQFKFNLLSVSALTSSANDHGLMVRFLRDSFYIQELRSQRMIGKGGRRDGLYVLDSTTLVAASTTLINSVSVQTWHNCLGHLSFKRLESLKDQLICDVSTLNKAGPCYVCPLAKQRRLSFVSHHHMSALPFDIIHCDIWGPHHVASYSGFRFFLTLVDDCTRFTWVFLLKHKSDAMTVLPRFFAMVHRQFDAGIKMLRSDNAPELKMAELCADQGVLHQFSCVEHPQQNSVVERKHQHLLNVARSLYFQSRVPIEFWSDCVLTATYLINRTPSPLIQHETPYQHLYKSR